MAKLSSTVVYGDLDVSNELDVGDEIYEDDLRVATRNWVDGEVSVAASSLSGLDSAVDSNDTDISSLQSNKLDASNYNPEADTHSRYTDSEAITAVDGEVSVAASSVSGLDSAVDGNDSDISSLQTNKLDSADYNPEADTHSRYTNSEAVSAVNAESSLSVDITGDADTVDGKNADELGNTDAEIRDAIANGDSIPHPVYASTGDVPALAEGESVYISGDGLYVEDGT